MAAVPALVTLATLIALVGALTLLSQQWLSVEEKRSITDRVGRLAAAIETSQGVAMVQLPLQGLKLAYDALLGPTLFGRRAVKRTAVLSILVLLAGLAFAWGATGATLGFKKTPWQRSDAERELVERLMKTAKDPTEAEAASRFSALRAEEGFYESMLALQGTQWRVAYSVWMVTGIVVINFVFDLLCLALTRKMIQDMIRTPNASFLLGIMTMGVVLTLVLASVATILAICVVSPSMWIPVIGVMEGFLYFPTLALLFYAFVVGVHWWIAEPWLLVLCVTSLLPLVLLMCAVLASLALLPARRLAARAAARIGLLVSENEKGFLGLVSGTSAAVGTLLFVLIKLLGE